MVHTHDAAAVAERLDAPGLSSSPLARVARRAASFAYPALGRVTAFVLLLPGLARLAGALVTGEGFAASDVAAWLLPGVLPVAFLAWLGRRGAAPVLARLRKEAWGPAWVAALGAALLTPAAAGVAGFPAVLRDLVAMVVLPLVGVVGFVEAEYGTEAGWLTQPLPRRRLYAEKVGVVAVFAAVLAAQVVVCAGVPASPVSPLWGLAIALGLGPVLALTAKDAVHAVLGAAFVGVMGTLATLSDEVREAFAQAFGIPGWVDAALPVPVALGACALVAAAPWLAVGRAARFAWPDLSTARWWRVTGRSPLGTLVRKELRLQLEPLAVSAWSFGAWLLAAWSSGRPDLPVVAVGFFGLMGALLAGVVAVSSEHVHGTFTAEAVAHPASRAWRVKLLVSGAVALLVAVVVPALLVRATPGLLSLRDELTVGGSWAEPERMTDRNVLAALTAWLGLAGVAWSGGLVASTWTRRLTVSFLAGLAVVVAALAVFSTSLSVFAETRAALFEPCWGSAARPAFCGWAELDLPTWLRGGLALGCVVLPPVALLRVAASSWRTSRVPVRAVVVAVLLLSLAGVSGALALF